MAAAQNQQIPTGAFGGSLSGFDNPFPRFVSEFFLDEENSASLSPFGCADFALDAFALCLVDFARGRFVLGAGSLSFGPLRVFFFLNELHRQRCVLDKKKKKKPQAMWCGMMWCVERQSQIQ